MVLISERGFLSCGLILSNFEFSLRRIKTNAFPVLKIRGNHEIWDIIGFLPNTEEEKIKEILGFPTGYRIKLEDLVSGQGIARYASVYLKEIGKEDLFNEFIQNGRLTGKAVAEAFNKGNPEQRKVAEEIFYRIGRYLGMGIKALVLNEGEKAEVEWSKEDWNYWRKVRQIILGGFIPEAGEEAEVLIKGAKDLLTKEGLGYIEIKRAPFKGKEAGILGTVAYVVSQKGCCFGKEGEKRIGILAIDFGRTHIATGIVEVNSSSGDLSSSPQSAILYKKDSKVKIWIEDPKGGTFKDREVLIDQFVEEIVEAITYAQRYGIPLAKDIGICSPGVVDEDGYFTGGINYLPFGTKGSGFHLPSILEEKLAQKGYLGYKIYLLNDGVAQALGNIRYGLQIHQKNMIGYMGLGSGLGGGLIEINN